ncbi:MAG: hypothetical protein NZ932_03470 [Candidatus Bathyarchaeota archaeon]|nr:hypothetical protein [Candidatus Bathyarchaeota archaeon]
MSARLEIPLSELKDWLGSQISPAFTPVQVRAEKLLKEMREAHENLIEACKLLIENSRKEIEKHNPRTFKRAQALNKLAKLFLERLQPLKVPEKPSFKDVEEFISAAQKAYAVTDVDVKNWFPRISPFFIMDRGRFLRVFEGAEASLKELGGFLAKEYGKAKTLEETFQLVEEIGRLKNQLASLENECRRIEGEKAKLEEELDQTKRRRAELESGGEIAELASINETIECLRREISHSLRHLQKPLVKLQSIAVHGSGSGLTPEETRKLNEYLADPFEALATESTGYPLLRQILQKTARLMSEGKLKLKEDKERKARQSITEIVDKTSLTSLHHRCVGAKTRKTQLSTSSTITEAKAEILRLREHADNLQKKLERLESETASIKKKVQETVKQIESAKSRVEKNILDFSGREITLII